VQVCPRLEVSAGRREEGLWESVEGEGDEGGLGLGYDVGCFLWSAVGGAPPDFFAPVETVEYDEAFAVLAMRVGSDVSLCLGLLAVVNSEKGHILRAMTIAPRHLLGLRL